MRIIIRTKWKSDTYTEINYKWLLFNYQNNFLGALLFWKKKKESSVYPRNIQKFYDKPVKIKEHL